MVLFGKKKKETFFFESPEIINVSISTLIKKRF